MCPGMPHAKFRSPSINIDRDFQLSAGHSQRARQTARQGNDQGVELRLCPKAKGGAKNIVIDQFKKIVE